MAGHRNRTRGHANGTNGNGAQHIQVKLPTIDELRKAYEEGLEQTLLSGVQVIMRPVRADMLLASGKVPDILRPLIMNMLFPVKKEVPPDTFPDEVGDYLAQPRDETKETLDFIESVNVVCEAALIDPSIVPYLSLSDRMWVFKLAFMPVAVLSRFRIRPKRDVDTVEGEQGQSQPTERDDARDRVIVPIEPADGVPI